MKMKMQYKLKFVAKALGYFIISPVYVPAVIVYENRQEVYDFYSDVWKIVTLTHPMLKDKD